MLALLVLAAAPATAGNVSSFTSQPGSESIISGFVGILEGIITYLQSLI